MVNTSAGYKFDIDLTQVSREIKQLDKADASAIRKQIRQAIDESAQEMLSMIRTNASWSSKIPAATSVRTTLSTRRAKVTVLVDQKKAPHARALELGNRNQFDEAEIAKRAKSVKVGNTRIQVHRRIAMRNMRKEGVGVTRMDRHPVFAKKGSKRYENKANWVAQSIRPFFFPAAEEEAPRVDARIDQALDQIARDAGFK